jgi:hypothetical protein
MSAAPWEGLYCAEGRFRTLRYIEILRDGCFCRCYHSSMRPATRTVLLLRAADSYTLKTCVSPDGTEKRGAEVTFRESAEDGIRCTECASQRSPQP